MLMCTLMAYALHIAIDIKCNESNIEYFDPTFCYRMGAGSFCFCLRGYGSHIIDPSNLLLYHQIFVRSGINFFK